MKQPVLTGIHGKEQLQKHLFRTAASCEVKVALLAGAIQNPIAVLHPLHLEPELFQKGASMSRIFSFNTSEAPPHKDDHKGV